VRNFSRYLFILLTLAPVHLAEAQQAARVPLIGWLSARVASVPGLEQFRQELGRFGYIEGKNIAFESRYAENQFDRLPTLAEELIRLRVDVLLTPSTIEAVAAKNATRNIPIVVVSAADPVAAGLIDSLARPGGNITGVTNISAVLTGKQLELLKETVPTLSRVAIMWDPQAPGSVHQWKESQMPARELGLQLHSMKVSSALMISRMGSNRRPQRGARPSL
jgi:putative tryptophan/tyrosine transport system substrate-binding protein